MILFSLLVAMFLFQCYNSQLCTDPVKSFNSTQFTIRGPCPNDTVLLALVGDTVHYRCDYNYTQIVDEYDPYWHIAEFDGTPFFQSSDERIAGGSSNVNAIYVGHTTLSILVKQKYLDSTLDIQCGLCSEPVRYAKGDKLRENIISTSVKIVSVGSPSNLYTVSNSNGIVTLSWSPPLTAADYCTCNDCRFEYTVNLTDEADHSITLYTQQTTLNVTRLNITDNGLDPCVNYTWSVTAVHNEFETKTVMGNQSFFLQAEAEIISGLDYTIGECISNSLELFVNFSVTALQPLNTLKFALLLHTISEESYFFNDDANRSITLIADDVVSIKVTLYDWMYTNETFIAIAINNECGTTESAAIELNIDNVFCPEPPSISSSLAMTPYTSFTFTSEMLSFSCTPSILPSTSIKPTSSTTRPLVSIGISVGSGLLLTAIVLLILICILIVYKKTRKFKLNVERDANIDNTAYSAIYNGVYKSVVSDYISPVEAIDAKEQYTAAIDISTESQYCEPEQLFSSKTGTLPLPVHSHQNKPVSESGATWDSSGLEEVAGYCVPPVQDKKFKNRNSKSGSTKKKNVPMQNPAPLYADVEKMRELKSEAKNRSGYASLDLPPPSEAPPPLPLPHNPYSTIAPHESPPPIPPPFIDTEYDIIGSCEDTPPPPLDQ